MAALEEQLVVDVPLVNGHPDARVGCVVFVGLRRDELAVVVEVGHGDHGRDLDVLPQRIGVGATTV